MFYHIEDENLSRTILKTRRRILEVSFELFSRDGIFKTTMVDIAGEVDVTRRTLYNHFATKEEIAILLHQLLLKDLLSRCDHYFVADELTAEGIRKCLGNIFEAMRENHGILSFLVHFDMYVGENPQLFEEEDFFVEYLMANTPLISYFESLQKTGHLEDRNASPEMLARIFFETIIAYMERISYREKSYMEEGLYQNSGFAALTDTLLSSMTGSAADES